VFATVQVAGARRSWLPAATLLVAVVALIGSAILAAAPGRTDQPDAALVAPPSEPVATVVETASPRGTSRPATGGAAPALLQVEARPNGRYVFVNGDVFSMAAFRVEISLEAGDTVAATRSVNLPGGSTAFLTGANPRFQVQFDVPAEVGALWITATAYDLGGDIVASLHQPVLSRIVALASSVTR
jgi:hypothetical protein